MKRVIFLIFFCYYNLTPQVIMLMKSFDLSNTNLSLTGSSFSSDSNGNLFHFWADSVKLFCTKSNDAGFTWTTPLLLHETNYPIINKVSSIISSSGRVFVFFWDTYVYYKYSDDNGITWSEKIILPTGTGLNSRITKSGFPLVTSDGTIQYIYSRNTGSSTGIFRISSSNDGVSWSTESKLLNNPNVGSPSLVSLQNGIEVLYFLKTGTTPDTIFSITSTDFGITWTITEKIEFISPSQINSVVSLVDTTGKFYLIYDTKLPTPFEGYFNNEIMFLISSDQGTTWNSPQSYTLYKGYDANPKICLFNGKPFVSFLSKRRLTNTESLKVWFGFLLNGFDRDTPPMVYRTDSYLNNSTPSTAFFRAAIDDESQIIYVDLIYDVNGKRQPALSMYDNGTNGDSIANDKIYSAEITGHLENGDNLLYYIKAMDAFSNEVIHYGGVVLLQNEPATSTYLLDVNRIKLPLENSGVIADLEINGIRNATYDSVTVLFSAGFYLSGINNSTIWTNAISSSARIQDYRKGRVGVPYDDPRNKIYVVSKNDPPFSNSWQNWKTAVTMGADFYDGNNDGIYNPVDLNSNGIWDPNEDKPDIIGDVTTYCVYNDAVPSFLRRFNDVNPLGIEIGQTVFAYADSTQNALNNAIFIRYKIVNTGTVSSVMDSVYFSFWSDPDVGDGWDDLVGCDTILNVGFTYHKSQDITFGVAAPTVMTSILQGPHYYKPGETFIDNNNNGYYDEGIDTPTDTAYNRKGSSRGIDIFPGARNRNMTSFIHNPPGIEPLLGSANASLEARNYLMGKDRFGNFIDPCLWSNGSVIGENCSSVNPVFMYSGNPAANTGWLNTVGTDQRILVNTGPFTLKANEPMEIIGTFLVGRKDDPFSSFYEARRIASYAGSFYRSNFGLYPLGVEEEPSTNVNDFVLYQNYPNPFNPVTTIKYHIPETGLVSLKVYNILGEEVTTLVNEIKRPGSYTIDFNAGKLASGVYFYELSVNHFRTTKKFLLMK
jgi:hypothetical protein